MTQKHAAGTLLALALLGACRDSSAPVAPLSADLSSVSNNISAASGYTAQDLGVLPGGVQSAGYAINNNGDVVGSSETSSGVAHPVLWATGAAAKDLGMPWGTTAAAYGVNNAKTVVGYATTGASSVGWIWKSGTFTLIKGGSSSPLVTATAVNNSDVVVGYYRAGSPAAFHAFKYTIAGGIVDLHPGIAYKESEAYAISDQGVVVGSALLTSGQRHAAQWSATGVFSDLGTLGGRYGEAAAVNNLGQVIGISSDVTNRNKPFEWNPGGAMVIVAPTGEVSGISDKGRIVGSYNAFPMTKKGSSPTLTLPGLAVPNGGNGLAYGVNTCGDVAGSTSVAYRVFHAARWKIATCD